MEDILRDFPMPITTPRTVLRPPKIGDGLMVNQAIIESLDILSPFMPWATISPSLEDTEVYVRQSAANWILKVNEEPYLPLLVMHRQSQEFIGAVGFHKWDWDVAKIEIGYWLRKSYLGQGYMTEAVNAVTRYAFTQLQVNRCDIRCDAENIRSQKIPERLNYTFEASLKANLRSLTTGELSDLLIYAKYDLLGLPDLEVAW